VDEEIVSQLITGTTLGNQITLQIQRPRVAGRRADSWTADAFEAICDALSPAWGIAHHSDEYWAKVFSDPPRIHAIGRDLDASYLACSG
jgi:hypothetical protein